MSRINVTWEICDGYIGGARPQTTMVETSDFAGLPLKEAQDLLSSILKEALEERVSWDCPTFDDTLEKIMREAKRNA